MEGGSVFYYHAGGPGSIRGLELEYLLVKTQISKSNVVANDVRYWCDKKGNDEAWN